MTTEYVDASTGATAESVYVTTIDGDEIGSYRGCDWTDALIEKLEKRHGGIRAVFCGGTLDGYEAI
jgi:hypothetical protein